MTCIRRRDLPTFVRLEVSDGSDPCQIDLVVDYRALPAEPGPSGEGARGRQGSRRFERRLATFNLSRFGRFTPEDLGASDEEFRRLHTDDDPVAQRHHTTDRPGMNVEREFIA